MAMVVRASCVCYSGNVPLRLSRSSSSLLSAVRSLSTCTGVYSFNRSTHMATPPSVSSPQLQRPTARFASLSPLGFTTPSESVIPQIEISASELEAIRWKGDILAVGVSSADLEKDESGAFKSGTLRRLDDYLQGILGSIVTEEDFNGKAGQSTFVRLPGFGFKRIGLVGIDLSQPAVLSKWKSFGEAVAGVAKTAQAGSVAITLANLEEVEKESLQSKASAIATGVTLGLHEDLRFKSEKKKPTLKSLEFLGFGSGTSLEAKLQITQKICQGICLTRELVNAPPNVVTPDALADEALSLGSTFEDVLTVQILDEEKCRELKMGAYLGVAAASTTNPPKFIHIQYKPPNEVKSKLAIVGKGLTFDSGGYNLKAGAGSMIELMKFDMGGAGAALGAAKAIAAIRPLGVEVHFVVAACENMVSGTGMRPGDILTASNGKTIEVNNTDAEGRLTLADALVYSCKQGVHKIVDLATLTGACVVALGNDIAGMFTPSDDLAKELMDACGKAGEKLWRMPMEEGYWEMMKSGIADMVNTGGRAGGSITAALFLKQYVDENVQWAHLDIAGPVWNEKKKGATGFAVGTLVEWVLSHSS
ncbi:hypothetical protein GOP47_0018639 [Adiantum capillus-veneris]|uniref:Cytosol aminopeptidase domain-containing protein n=1 Tax=Adiantum capillus-veneris TaxID=13818 RepID=A0A9D4UDY3_ADICA|nr:hypothetical protein GOP47_0018639 [Adiantum capillus-veneris]